MDPHPSVRLARGSGRRASFWLLAAGIAMAGIALEARRAPALFTPAGVLFEDPDDWLRVHRARRILEEGMWRIGAMPEINHPLGAELHWTSPADWLLASAGAAIGPLVGGTDPTAAVAAWLPVAFGAGYSLLMALLVARLAGPAAGCMAGGLVVFSPAFYRAFQLGHADHHFLLEALQLLAVFAWTRRDGHAPRPRAAALGGAAIGLALWISPVALVVWAFLLAGVSLAAFWAAPEEHGAWRQGRIAWTAAALVMVVAGWLIENWPDLSRVSADKLSLFHVVLVAASLWVPDGPAMDHGRRRGGLAQASGVAGLLGAWMILDRGRIFEHMSRPEFRRWSALVAELQPLVAHAGGEWSLAPLHRHLGCLPYALPVAVYFFARSRTVGSQMKLPLGLMALGFTAASLVQRRWLDAACLGLVPVIVVGLGEACRRWAGRWGRHAPTAAMIVLVSALAWPAAAGVLTPPAAEPSPHVLRTAEAARAIREHAGNAPADRGGAILCEDGEGPMLLYLTRRPVVAAPYHRALEGLLEAARFYAERDAAAARGQLDRLGVAYVVVPYRAHEQLMNFERIAFGELRSYDPPGRRLDGAGRLRETLRYRPEITRTMSYRLALSPDTALAGLQPIARAREGAATPDGLSGLVLVVERPATGPGGG
jgi:hypothetical protein